MDERNCYIAFSHVIEIGPYKFDQLLAHFGTAEKAYHAKESELAAVCGSKLAQKFVAFRSTFNAEAKLKEYAKSGITVVSRVDPLFPAPLKEIADAPIALYIKGDIRAYNFEEGLYFAIVGTRTPTAYGQTLARKFSRELGAAGATIVSGMALGIDALAHFGALDVEARTIAFLGCGVDIIYPPANRGLYSKILGHGGLVLSEFPPGTQVRPWFFVARNRLISGLSRGVLVVEGAADSGTLITARCAATQGKDVFAPPAPLTSRLSEAPNLLLKQGAKMVTTVSDILEEYHEVSKTRESNGKTVLTGAEETIYTLLAKEPHMADELALSTATSIDETLRTLSMLEIKGVVLRNSEGKFEITTTI